MVLLSTRLDPDSLNYKHAKDSPSKLKAPSLLRGTIPPPCLSYARSISRRSDPSVYKPTDLIVVPIETSHTSASTLHHKSKPIASHTQHLAYYVVRFHPIPLTRDLSADCPTQRWDVDLLGRNKAYATIFSYFTLASLPQVLLEHLLNLFEAEAVGALGIFVADPQGLPCLRLVHGLWKYPGPLAQHSPNKNKAFGYLDDIEGEAGELVLVDSAMLSPTIASRVLTLDHHLAELEAHPGRLSIPVIPEGTGHSELIRAYKAFFIPFKLVHFLLGKGLSPSQALGLQNLGETPSSFSRAPPFEHKVMYRDLPKLERPWDPPGDPALTAAVTALTDHQLTLSENMDHKRLQSVRTTWDPLYTQRLLLLC
eukprot:jgi/Psemu1/60699/gm1.60699_g